jgi:hypothetical protein
MEGHSLLEKEVKKVLMSVMFLIATLIPADSKREGQIIKPP